MQVQESQQTSGGLPYTRIAVIRLKGLADASPEVEKTLDLLRLRRRYACVIIDERPSYLGMLDVVKDWVTWGEIDADTLAELLRRRGRLIGDKPLTDDWVKKYGWSSINEFALAYILGEVGFIHRLVVLGVLREVIMRVVIWVIGVLRLMS